jgi:hypothetical protein
MPGARAGPVPVMRMFGITKEVLYANASVLVMFPTTLSEFV